MSDTQSLILSLILIVMQKNKNDAVTINSKITTDQRILKSDWLTAIADHIYLKIGCQSFTFLDVYLYTKIKIIPPLIQETSMIKNPAIWLADSHAWLRITY